MSSATTSWYGKSPAKQLQQLLQTRPKLTQLLAIPQFIQQLKSYNPKLLQFLTNNPSIISEAIELITVSPLESDSHERKFKLPLQVIQMIETQTTCILNAFFKENVERGNNVSSGNNLSGSNNSKKQLYLDQLFNYLGKLMSINNNKNIPQQTLLPLLSGYFFRTCVCLINNRYKQTLQFIYSRPHIFNILIFHSQSMPICNTLQLFINLDVNKSIGESDTMKLQKKKQAIKKILEKIQNQRKINMMGQQQQYNNNNSRRQQSSSIVIENLMNVLIQTIQKYYLIQDGKALIQLLTSQQTVITMLQLTKQNNQLSYPAFSFFISLINYYSFSSFNADQVEEEKRVKNLARLQSQPMVVGLRQYFSVALNKVTKAQVMTLYQYKLLQMLCHCISISSEQLLQKIKQTQFFAQLIMLLFKHPNNNILHMLIEKSFLHVFISERKIYQKYKKHLFCEIDIIQLTAGKVLRQNDQTKLFQKLRKFGGFGHFMRILKIYSGIQTTEESIITAIKSKTQIWNKIATYLIKPYESICFKQLGTYQNLQQGKYQQFQVTKSVQSNTINSLESNKKPLTNSMIEEIRKEDELLPVKKQDEKNNRVLLSQMVKEENILQKKKQEQLLKSPTNNFTIDFKSHLRGSSSSNPPTAQNTNKNNDKAIAQKKQQPQQQKQIKKTQSFKQFMSKKKVEAQQQIRLKRSLSHEKRLSGSKGKITGMSPKKNSWTEKSSEEGEDKDKLNGNSRMSSSAVVHTKNASDMPNIPHYSQHASLSSSSASQVSANNNNKKQHSNQQQPPLSTSSKSTTPTAYRSYYGSSIQTRTSPTSSSPKQQSQSVEQSISNLTNKNNNDDTMSQKNMELLKKIKVIRIQAPKQKKYRKLEEKDKVLLEFLGIQSK